MKTPIQCQEKVYKNNHSLQNEPNTDELYAYSHQCSLAAKYKIKTIDLYICHMHAIGINKKQLIKLKR